MSSDLPKTYSEREAELSKSESAPPQFKTPRWVQELGKWHSATERFDGSGLLNFDGGSLHRFDASGLMRTGFDTRTVDGKPWSAK